MQELRLEWVDPKTLTPNPSNWRVHPPAQREALAGVLEEVGWAGALLWNESTGRLVDGHLRLDVALRENRDAVPVLIGSWTEAQEKEILATLDPIAAMAEADGAQLDALLRDVNSGSAAVMDMLAGLAEGAGLIEGDPLQGMIPADSRYKEQYGVIVVCSDEAHQESVFNDLKEAGYEVKVVVT